MGRPRRGSAQRQHTAPKFTSTKWHTEAERDLATSAPAYHQAWEGLEETCGTCVRERQRDRERQSDMDLHRVCVSWYCVRSPSSHAVCDSDPSPSFLSHPRFSFLSSFLLSLSFLSLPCLSPPGLLESLISILRDWLAKQDYDVSRQAPADKAHVATVCLPLVPTVCQSLQQIR